MLLALPAVLPMADVYSLSGMEAEDWLVFALIVLYVMGLGTLFSVLCAPFLPFQKWIVGPAFPQAKGRLFGALPLWIRRRRRNETASGAVVQSL